MKSRKLSFIIAMMLGINLLSACGSGQEAPRGDGRQQEEQGTELSGGGAGDSVIVAMGPNSEPEAGFDPAYGWGAGEHVHEPLIQSTLTVTNPDLSIGYDLATDMQVSEDGMIWTVTIRDDVKFTDGEALTASDVAFTYNTVKEISSVNDFTMLAEAVAVDDTTVEFHMAQAYYNGHCGYRAGACIRFRLRRASHRFRTISDETVGQGTADYL